MDGSARLNLLFVCDGAICGGLGGEGRFKTIGHCVGTQMNAYGPVRIRAEKGAADGGTVHVYCAGHPGSVVEFRHSEVKL